MSRNFDDYQRESHALREVQQPQGELQPYSPSQPLAPAPDWSATDVDLLRETTDSYPGDGQMVLGQPLQPGVSLAQVTDAYKQLGNVFVGDFLKLGHNISQTQKAVAWFMSALTNPPKATQKHHKYNLYEHTNDPIFQAFANYASDNGFSAKFVSDACWWVTEASKRLNTQQVAVSQQPRTAPSNSDPTEQFTDQQYAQYIEANKQARIQTLTYLEALWGSRTQANLQMVDAYYMSLPLQDQQALNQITTGGVEGLNTREVILFLFNQSIGGSLPTGAALTAEIEEHHRAMAGPNRKQWMNDERMGARYRELIRIRDGG